MKPTRAWLTLKLNVGLQWMRVRGYVRTRKDENGRRLYQLTEKGERRADELMREEV